MLTRTVQVISDRGSDSQTHFQRCSILLRSLITTVHTLTRVEPLAARFFKWSDVRATELTADIAAGSFCHTSVLLYFRPATEVRYDSFFEKKLDTARALPFTRNVHSERGFGLGKKREQQANLAYTYSVARC